MIARALYFVGKAFGSIRESPWVSLLTTATTGAALLIAGLYAMALANLEQLALVWGRSASVAAYVADHLPAADWERLRGELAARPEVEHALLVRPREALERFRARGPAAASLVAGVDESALPAVIELELRPASSDLETIAKLASELAGIPGIAEIDYGREEFERLRALLGLLRWGGLAGAVLVAFAMAFIVANTVRLTVFARREEIEILSLVGATGWFIRLPFVLEGAFWGAAGGGMAAGALFVLDRWVAPHLTAAVAQVLGGIEVHLFTPGLGLAATAVGTVLGAFASGLAVRRFLDLELR